MKAVSLLFILFTTCFRSTAQGDTLRLIVGTHGGIRPVIHNNPPHQIQDTLYTIDSTRTHPIVKDQTVLAYFDSGYMHLAAKLLVKGDSLIEANYYRNGNLKHLEVHLLEGDGYEQNAKWAYQAHWCPEGRLKFEWHPNHQGVQHIIDYYCNGNIMGEYSMIGPVNFCGEYKQFFENGQLAIQGYWTDCSSVPDSCNDCSLPIDVWTYYDEKGTILRTEKMNQELVLDSLVVPEVSYSQRTDRNKLIDEKNYQEVKLIDTSGGFTLIDSWPMFPDGESGMIKFLGENITYPAKAKQRGIQGMVIVGFTVQNDGTVSEVHVVESVHSLLDAEAVLVVGLMENWLPAVQRGKPVKLAMQLPINFAL